MAQCSSVSNYPSYAQTSWFSYQHSGVSQRDTAVSFWSRISRIIGTFRLRLVSIPMHHDAASTLLLCLKVFYSKFTQIFYLFILDCIASHCYKRFRETPSVSSKYIVWAFFCLQTATSQSWLHSGAVSWCGFWKASGLVIHQSWTNSELLKMHWVCAVQANGAMTVPIENHHSKNNCLIPSAFHLQLSNFKQGITISLPILQIHRYCTVAGIEKLVCSSSHRKSVKSYTGLRHPVSWSCTALWVLEVRMCYIQ